MEDHAHCFASFWGALVDLPSWRLAPKLMQHRPKQLLRATLEKVSSGLSNDLFGYLISRLHQAGQSVSPRPQA